MVGEGLRGGPDLVPLVVVLDGVGEDEADFSLKLSTARVMSARKPLFDGACETSMIISRRWKLEAPKLRHGTDQDPSVP